MRVLLTDGSGLTARQTATILSRAGHTVEVVSPDPLCLCRFTRHVRRIHRVPGYSADPFRWLDATIDVYRRIGADALLPTQEAVAVLSAAAARADFATAVPPFAALASVQDKASAGTTLSALDVPRPPSIVLTEPDDDGNWDAFPAFVKDPIGTASRGVTRVASVGELRRTVANRFAAGASRLVVQAEVVGPLVMTQTVFADGELVACHAVRRVRAGASGGSSHKRSVLSPAIDAAMRALGEGLGWHGALSADVILGPDGPVLIDINPRLVEPMNAYLSGVDLVSVLLEIATGRPMRPQPASRAGVDTHQLLSAVLGAAEAIGSRRAVARELLAAVHRRGVEELTPVRGDPTAAVPVLLAAVATLARPAASRWFTAGSVSHYALTPQAWQRIVDRAGGA